MRQISKSAKPCHLTDLQSLVAQQVFCFFQADLQQIAFGSGRKEAAVITVKLAFLQTDARTETFQAQFCSQLESISRRSLWKEGFL